MEARCFVYRMPSIEAAPSVPEPPNTVRHRLPLTEALLIWVSAAALWCHTPLAVCMTEAGMDSRTFLAIAIIAVVVLGVGVSLYLTRPKRGASRHVSRLDRLRRPRAD